MIIKFKDYQGRTRGINPEHVSDVEVDDVMDGISHTLLHMVSGQQRGVQGKIDDVIHQLNAKEKVE